MRIACLEHVPFEGPGAIAEWAVQRGHALSEVAVFREALPAVGSFDMLVVMGGPMGAADDEQHPWLPAERAFIREAADAGRPVIGVCLGAQLLAVALGGSITRNETPEIGWFPLEVTGDRADTVFADWPDSLMAGHWHGDTFELPSDVAVMASSAACARQAYVARGGRAVGLQCHVEWTEAGLSALIEACGDELVPGPFVQSANELLGGVRHLATARRALFGLLDRMEALA